MVTVLITTYNSSLTIIETLESILNQTYKKFEVVIVDDGSTDDTISILNKYIVRHPIRLYKAGKIGRAAALNLGISNSNFDWISICDSDDIWHPLKLEIQVQQTLKKSDIDLICTNTLLFSSNYCHVEYSTKELNFYEINLKSILVRNEISHSSVFIKKNILHYNESLNSQIDYEHWLRLLYENNIKAIKLNLNLVYHRIHNGQSFESKGLGYRVSSIKLVNSYCLKGGFYFIFIINNLKIIYYVFSRIFIKLKSYKISNIYNLFY